MLDINNICKNCGICCLNTEMIITNEDINRIENLNMLNLKRKDFSYTNDGFNYLKNIDHHCIFLDNFSKAEKNICKIYENRPKGCQIYPMIYNLNNNCCILDEECPHRMKFYKNQKKFKLYCIELTKLIEKIYKEM